MYIDVYDDDCEEEDISLKDKKYTHLETMEAIYVMRSYMTSNYFPLESFNRMDIIHWTTQQQVLKLKKKELSVYSFFNRKKVGSSIQV